MRVAGGCPSGPSAEFLSYVMAVVTSSSVMLQVR